MRTVFTNYALVSRIVVYQIFYALIYRSTHLTCTIYSHLSLNTSHLYHIHSFIAQHISLVPYTLIYCSTHLTCTIYSHLWLNTSHLYHILSFIAQHISLVPYTLIYCSTHLTCTIYSHLWLKHLTCTIYSYFWLNTYHLYHILSFTAQHISLVLYTLIYGSTHLTCAIYSSQRLNRSMYYTPHTSLNTFIIGKTFCVRFFINFNRWKYFFRNYGIHVKYLCIMSNLPSSEKSAHVAGFRDKLNHFIFNLTLYLI